MPLPKDPQKLAEYKEKMRRIALNRGYGKWMTGKERPPEVQAKMAATQKIKGNTPEERQRRSEIAKAGGYGKWMAGREAPAHIQERNATSKGKTYEELYGENAENQRRVRRESNRARFPEKKQDRSRTAKHLHDFVYREWRTAVFERDDYTCQDCGERGGKLHAHHIKSWADYPDFRFEVANGLTLCVPCHRDVHFPNS